MWTDKCSPVEVPLRYSPPWLVVLAGRADRSCCVEERPWVADQWHSRTGGVVASQRLRIMTWELKGSAACVCVSVYVCAHGFCKECSSVAECKWGFFGVFLFFNYSFALKQKAK